MSNVVKKHQVLIIGAGTAGISTAAHLLKDHSDREWDIAIVDPSEKHYSQPLWTLVGAGIFPKEETCFIYRNRFNIFVHINFGLGGWNLSLLEKEKRLQHIRQNGWIYRCLMSTFKDMKKIF